LGQLRHRGRLGGKTEACREGYMDRSPCAWCPRVATALRGAQRQIATTPGGKGAMALLQFLHPPALTGGDLRHADQLVPEPRSPWLDPP
jgi:hypothetical protein